MKNGTEIGATISACPAILSGHTLQSKGTFQKVGECLYRYSSNEVYYARFESGGKQIRRSLRTTDRASAQRALAWLKHEREQVDPAQGKLTLAELCDSYSVTIQHRRRRRFNESCSSLTG